MSKKIILDPGHGGRDTGAGTSPPYESQLALEFSKVLAQAFETQGFQVAMTRTEDVHVPLDDRCKGTEGAAAFLSIHMDGAVSEKASGPSVWVHSKAPKSYLDWGQAVVDGLKGVGITSNRAQAVHRGHVDGPQYDYKVNRDTIPPSRLLEMGFATNEANRREITGHAQEYAQAVVQATCKFLGEDYTPQEGKPNPDSKTISFQELGEMLRQYGIYHITLG